METERIIQVARAEGMQQAADFAKNCSLCQGPEYGLKELAQSLNDMVIPIRMGLL